MITYLDEIRRNSFRLYFYYSEDLKEYRIKLKENGGLIQDDSAKTVEDAAKIFWELANEYDLCTPPSYLKE